MTLKTWSFSKKKNSTAQPTGQSRDYNVYMKENTSIENPVFILGTGITADISYCQWSGNYYFVDDIVLISADQVELHCSIDVLATHKTAIGNYSAFVERAASAYDTMIYDGAVSQTQELIGESFSTTQLWSNGANISSTGTFILGVIGGEASGSGGISVYALTPSELATALDFMFNDANSEYTDLFTDTIVKSFFNPFQYIVFLRWYPLTKAAFGLMDPGQKIKFGWWETSASYDKCLEPSFSTGATLTIPTPYYTDFRGYDQRFTQVYIDLPTVGFISLDPSLLHGTGIDILFGMNVDIVTGETVVYLERVTGSGLTTRNRLCKYSGHLGASIPVGQVNSNFGSIATGAVQTIAGALTENAALASSGLAGVAGSFAPPASVIGTYGSKASLSDMTTVKVSTRTYKTGGLLTTHYGRPLDQVRTINTLSGFVKCRAASLSLAAPDTEIEKVNSYLNSGFYYV